MYVTSDFAFVQLLKSSRSPANLGFSRRLINIVIDLPFSFSSDTPTNLCESESEVMEQF